LEWKAGRREKRGVRGKGRAEPQLKRVQLGAWETRVTLCAFRVTEGELELKPEGVARGYEGRDICWSFLQDGQRSQGSRWELGSVISHVSSGSFTHSGPEKRQVLLSVSLPTLPLAPPWSSRSSHHRDKKATGVGGTEQSWK
jgi:hypothetical protein